MFYSKLFIFKIKVLILVAFKELKYLCGVYDPSERTSKRNVERLPRKHSAEDQNIFRAVVPKKILNLFVQVLSINLKCPSSWASWNPYMASLQVLSSISVVIRSKSLWGTNNKKLKPLNHSKRVHLWIKKIISCKTHVEINV